MFCRIYIAGENINRKVLLIPICNLIEAELVGDKYIEKNGYSIEVRSNDDFNKEKAKVYPDGFLYFPFCIEIDIEDSINTEDAAKEISKILNFLWANNYTASASCDFEDLLPESGGYKSINIPWSK